VKATLTVAPCGTSAPTARDRALFGALQGNQHATNAFMSAITGAIPLTDFMSDENVGRIMGGRGRDDVVD
jgi:hypothetical protein